MEKPVNEMSSLELLVEIFKGVYGWWREEWLKPSVYVLLGFCTVASLIKGGLPDFDGFVYVACSIVFAPFLFVAYNLIILIANTILLLPAWIFDNLFGGGKDRNGGA